MARIYESPRPAPSANKADRPVVETKTDATATVDGNTAGTPAAPAETGKGRGRPKKDDTE